MSEPGRLFPDKLQTLLSLEELAIVGSVIYSSLFRFPVTPHEVERTALGAEIEKGRVVDTYLSSLSLQAVLDYREGYFFPKGCSDFIKTRREREMKSRAFLNQHRFVLRLICSIPYTRMVALSGSAAHLNIGDSKDLDLLIICQGSKVWSIAVMGIIVARILRCRDAICINFVLADSRLQLRQHDLFNANQLIHLQPLLGISVFERFLAENPFVQGFYPGSLTQQLSSSEPLPGGGLKMVKTIAELLLRPGPGQLFEWFSQRIYRSHLRRKASGWTSPEAVVLEQDYLKLHSHSHRHKIMNRFDQAIAAVERQLEGRLKRLKR